jgi:hypothetical protein
MYELATRLLGAEYLSKPIWQNGTISVMDSVQILFEPGVREVQQSPTLALT